MKNDTTTAGPATYFDRAPGKTYTPTPMVLPTPNAVRSVVDSTLSNMDDSRTTPAIVFFRFNFLPTAIVGVYKIIVYAESRGCRCLTATYALCSLARSEVVSVDDRKRRTDSFYRNWPILLCREYIMCMIYLFQ